MPPGECICIWRVTPTTEVAVEDKNVLYFSAITGFNKKYVVRDSRCGPNRVHGNEIASGHFDWNKLENQSEVDHALLKKEGVGLILFKIAYFSVYSTRTRAFYCIITVDVVKPTMGLANDDGRLPAPRRSPASTTSFVHRLCGNTACILVFF